MTAVAEQPGKPVEIDEIEIADSGFGRLYRGQSSIDFIGKIRAGFILSGILLVLTVLSLSVRGLDLGIDFRGGISWDVPGSELTIADAERVLADNGLDPAGARIQRRTSDSGDFLKIQVEEQTPEVQLQLQTAFADQAAVEFDDVSVNVVSSSWGREITEKALRALLIFTAVVAVVIAVRYEWRMALAAIVAMIHDVVISVGIYSMLGFVVSPATVIAFLTILGYSLYDTIVIFDRVRENEARFEAHRAPYSDVINTTMNQVLMRTLNTSLSSMIPVLSILIVGAGLLGASTLAEFAVALLVGMLTGAYSSIFIASPLLAMMKRNDERWRGTDADRARDVELRRLVMGAVPTSVRSRTAAAAAGTRAQRSDQSAGGRRAAREAAETAETAVDETTGDERAQPRARTGDESPQQLLRHPPRPRKKKRR